MGRAVRWAAMRTALRTFGTWSAATATIGVALSVGACGGSSSTGHSAASATLAAYRSCLERHDVRAGGGSGTLASRIHNADYRTVLKDCGRPPRLPLSATAITILHAYTTCIAEHGYKLPTPNTSGNGPVFPAGTDRIRGYRTAAKSCISISDAALRTMYGAA